jgi:hypothetical protein
VFDSFVEENIGTDSENRPACYGTGDGHTYCLFCPFNSTC